MSTGESEGGGAVGKQKMLDRRTAFGRGAIAGAVIASAIACSVLLDDEARMYMTPFRESQTALVVQSMKTEGNWAGKYELPVCGVPWAVPFEFGLYQELVASLPSWGFSEVNRGKLVSTGFTVLCCLLVYALGREAGWCEVKAGWLCASFACAPVTLGYGTAYLMESTALAASLLYLLCGWRAIRGGGIVWGGVSLLAGVVSALVKPPTWAPACGALVLIAGAETITRYVRLDRGRCVQAMVLVVALVMIPLASAVAWTAYADSVKMLNTMAEQFTSDNTRAWYYGTWEQKLSIGVWAFVVAKSLLLSFGPAGIAVPTILFAGIVRVWKRRSPHGWLLVGALCVFASAPLVFTNLYFRHNYYLFANIVFVSAACVAATDQLWEKWWVRCWVVVTPAVAALSGLVFIQLQKAITQPVEDRVIEVLRSVPREGPVAFVGRSWSPRLVYESGRKGMFLSSLHVGVKQLEAVEENRGEHYVAIVWWGKRDEAMAMAAAGLLLGEIGDPLEICPGVWACVASSEHDWLVVAIRGSKECDGSEEWIRERVGRGKGFGPLVYWSVGLGRGREGAVEFGIRRGRELFFFDSDEWKVHRITSFYDVEGDGNEKR